MPIYNTWTDTFMYKGNLYGVGTTVIFKKDFVKSYRWKGQEIPQRGVFYNTWSNKNGEIMFQFQKYCPEWFPKSDPFPVCFSLTESDFIEAIEGLDKKPVPVEQVTVTKPSFADKHLDKNFKGIRKFFVYDDKYYGDGTEMYITDEFIDYYLHKTGMRLTKKVAFVWCNINQKGEIKYLIENFDDMKKEKFDDYEKNHCNLTEEEFFMAIEGITEPYIIKYKDRDEPVIFLLWIVLILLIVLSCYIFVKPSAAIVILLFGFFKIRKMLLFR